MVWIRYYIRVCTHKNGGGWGSVVRRIVCAMDGGKAR